MGLGFFSRWLAALRAALQGTYERVRGGQITPIRLALSVGVGLFVGCLPLYGTHLFLCAALTLPFRLNLIVAYAAAHISIPPSIPFLLLGSLELGSLLLSGRFVGITPSELMSRPALATGGAVLLGSVVLGLGLASIVGTVVFYSARFAQRHSSDAARVARFEQAMRRTVQRYRGLAPSVRHYVRIKLWVDPLASQLEAVFRELPLGWSQGPRRLVDIGCGRGQYSLLLVELGLVATVHGVDHDEPKVRAATVAARDVAATFTSGDVRTADYPEADAILLLDVLHYLPIEDQQALVQKAAQALAPGGVLLLRETDRSAGIGARLAATFERIGRALGINRGQELAFTTAQDLGVWLARAGLEAAPSERQPGLDNVLWLGRKPVSSPRT